jgi:hypothetical protein
MSTRSFVKLVFVVAACAAASWTRPAQAASGDAAAQHAADHAMNDLFLAAKFAEAKRALESSIQDCESGCSQKVRARLYRDLGVVSITGLHDTKRGHSAFKKARSLDPTIALDPMVTTPEIQSAFDAAAGSEPAAAETTAPPVVLEESGGGEESKKKKKKRHHVEEPQEEERVIVTCSRDSDCESNQFCKNGECVVRPPPPVEPIVWLSLGIMEDMLFVSGSDVCSRKSQIDGGFTCLRASGSQYHGTPLPGQGDKISATPTLASTRLTLSSYMRVTGPVGAGLRMGYVIVGQGPQADGGKKFVFYQAELMAQYWAGRRAFRTDRVGVFGQVSGGVAEIDGSVKVKVTETPGVIPPPSQLDNPSSQTLDAYKKTGSGFASFGLGMFLPFGSASGLLADLRFIALFPTSGFALSLGLSGALGL